MSIFDQHGFWLFGNDGTRDEEEQEKEHQEELCRLMEQYNAYMYVVTTKTYVMRGGIIGCEYGRDLISLDIYKDHGIVGRDSGLPVATIGDCELDNIHHFGYCKCPESQYAGRLPMTQGSWEDCEKTEAKNGNIFSHICVPLIKKEQKWKQIDDDLLIEVGREEYEPALLEDAVLVCQYGGIISVREIKIKEPEIEDVPGRGTVMTFPDVVSGTLNGQEKILEPNERWYAYQCRGSGTVKVGSYYKIVVGPKILDPNCDDAAKLRADDYGGKIYKRIDVELEKKPDYKTNNESEDYLTLECVACGVKAHTYNIHPDTTPEHAHKIFEYNKNITASFDIESGYVQTGIAYPNCWNAQNDNKSDGPIAVDYMDGSVIEFWGDSVDFSPKEYKLVRIIILNEDESDE